MTDTPAAPAPASRSGEDHVADLNINELLKDAEHLTSIFEYLNRPGNARDAARIEQFIRSIARDSGEAVRRAQAWPGDDLRQDVLLANGTDLAADVVALFASAARLKTDINDAQAKIVHLGKMAKRECERADDLEASAARLTEDNKWLREQVERLKGAWETIEDLRKVATTHQDSCIIAERRADDQQRRHVAALQSALDANAAFDMPMNVDQRTGFIWAQQIIANLSPTANPPEGQTRTPEQSIADAVNNPSIKAQTKRMEADKGPEWKA